MIISVPSYVIPGSYYENVKFIDRYKAVKSIELLFFFFDSETRELFKREKESIKAYTGRFSFTVHMPEHLTFEHIEIIELTRDLAARYILHLPETNTAEFMGELERWRARYGDIFLIENLIHLHNENHLKQDPTLPVCCDTGHLLLSGKDINDFLQNYETRIQEIHLHGVIDGKDHKVFNPKESWFIELIPFLQKFQGVVNLEVFSIKEVEEILNILSACNLI
ncbi:hypothetical protein ES705_26419 [subsurface metagenome]